MDRESDFHGVQRTVFKEYLLSEIIDRAPTGYLFVNHIGKIEESNSTASNMLAVEHSQLTGRSLADFIDHASQATWHLHLQQLLTTHRNQTTKLLFTRADGSLFVAAVESRVKPDLFDNHWCALLILTEALIHRRNTNIHALNVMGSGDVAENTLDDTARHEIVRTNDVFHNIFADSKNNVILYDSLANIIYANNAALHLLGANTEEEIVGNSLNQFFETSQSGPVSNLISAMLENNHSGQVMRKTLKTLDGDVLQVELNACQLLHHDDPVVQLILRDITSDITNSKSIKDILQINQNKAKRYLDTVDVIIVALDHHGDIKLINRKGCEVLGYQMHEVLGNNWFETCIPVEAGRYQVEKAFQEIINGHISCAEYYENYIVDCQGQRHLIAWHNTYLHDASGNVIGTLSAGEEIHNGKRIIQLDKQQVLQNRDLAQRLFLMQEKERGHLGRELHDEFGQWLTAIQLNAKTIKNLARGNSITINSCIESIINCTDHIQKDLRGFIHRLRPVLLDDAGLGESLRELVKQWRNVNSGVHCDLYLDGSLETLGDILDITIYRLVQEGLTNVSKHAQASHVNVSLQRENAATSHMESVCLTIEDDGIGLGTDFLEKGLGLQGMRERVIAAGGEFAISNLAGEGARLEAKFIIEPVQA